jgi:hypothetical protein
MQIRNKILCIAIISIVLFITLTGVSLAQLTAEEIIQKRDDNEYIQSSYAEATMVISQGGRRIEKSMIMYSLEKDGLVEFTNPADRGTKYLKRNNNLTIGRQPISWSFDSLLNPVDYSLGAVALEEDYSAKFQNDIEIYYPVNWHTSLSLVASSPGTLQDSRIGLGGKTLINDFDVTLHFVQEKVMAAEAGQQRFGITAKGDIGKYGVYGALGYYRDEKNSFSFLVGADYSYFFQAGNRLYLQAEYLNIPPNLLSQIIGSLMTGQPDSQDKNIHLLAGNASYQIDDFSGISLTSLCNISDGSCLFMPGYINQLSNSTTLEIQTGIAINTKNEAVSSSILPGFNKPSQVFIELGVSYAF